MLHDLETIGCSKAEAETFLVLSKYKDGISVLSLSRELNVPRPTIYSHLESLSNKGLVKKGLAGKGSIFYTESPKNILAIFEQRMIETLQSGKHLSEALDSLDKKNTFKPRFFVFEGPQSYEHILRDILSEREEIFFVWPTTHTDLKVSEEHFLRFQQERIRRGIWMNSLWPQTMKGVLKTNPNLSLENKDGALRRIRILPKGLDQGIGYGIYGSKVAFISLGSEDYSFIIESRELSHALKNQFDFLWNLSKEQK